MKQYNNKIKLAFHVHTYKSRDSLSRPADIVRCCRKNDISVIAITDHNEISGALEVKKLACGNPEVIVGEEIKSTDGEVIGLFLKEKIGKGGSAKSIIRKIKKQGGVVCIPHLGETLRRSSISRKKLLEIIDEVDIIEYPNSRTFFGRRKKWLGDIAKKYRKPKLAASDAHSIKHIKKSVNYIEFFNGKDDFMANLKRISNKTTTTNIFEQLPSLFVGVFRTITGT
jgi:predicted metal-dependent phosphoesterase TrpH